MIAQSAVKIYLSGQRGLSESDKFRTYSTFNFEDYYSEHRYPFDNLYLLNDSSLAGGQSVNIQIPESSCLILIPVVGAVSYHDSLGNENIVNAGEIQFLLTSDRYSIELANPFETDLINFLQICIKTEPRSTAIIPQTTNISLGENKNRLVRILPILDKSSDDFLCKPLIAMGKFTGRHEAVYKKNKSSNSLFVFVIEGAFEVEGRLLHGRDGLSLSGPEKEIELEALSNDAILFIMELSQ